VKGLRLYEDIFSESQLCKLNDFVKEIHAAGQNGELSGEFCRFNVAIRDMYINAMSNTMLSLILS
jgi:hypothetical protein